MKPGLWTNIGHFIVLWDIKDGIAYINDPASVEEIKIKNSYNYMASQCKQFFCFNKKPLLENSVCFFKIQQLPFVEFLKPSFNSYLF